MGSRLRSGNRGNLDFGFLSDVPVKRREAKLTGSGFWFCAEVSCELAKVSIC